MPRSFHRQTVGHQLPGEDTRCSLCFLLLLFSLNAQAEATTPRDEGYGTKVMFDRVSMALSSRQGSWMWGLVWDHRAGRGSDQGEQIYQLINPGDESYSPREGVLPGWLFSLHPGNVVKLYNQGRNLLIRAQTKLILLFILLQCLQKLC